jgi:hypothetical protein
MRRSMLCITIQWIPGVKGPKREAIPFHLVPRLYEVLPPSPITVRLMWCLGTRSNPLTVLNTWRDTFKNVNLSSHEHGSGKDPFPSYNPIYVPEIFKFHCCLPAFGATPSGGVKKGPWCHGHPAQSDNILAIGHL